MRATTLLAVLALTAPALSTPASAWVVPHRQQTAHRATAAHYAVRGAGRVHGRSGLVALVGDRESGLGFYPLPRQYRTEGAPRDRRGDAIRYAVATEAGTSYYYGQGGDGFADRRGRTLFNPVDGYGTPFFAGYYGPAGDPDEDRGPFGKPYN